MNDHDDIRRLLSAYSSGDLDPSLAARVELHLASCAVCRAELAELTTTLRLIRSTPEVDPPPWLTARVMARLKAQQAEKRSWLQRIFFPLHIKLPMEAMALLMVCVTGWYISRSVETELQPPALQHKGDTAVQPAPIDSNTADGKQAPPPRPAPQALPPPPQQPPAPKAAEQAAPRPGRDIQDAAPAYAPSPPAAKTERSSPAAGNRIEPARVAPAAESFQKARESVSEKKQGAADSLRTEAGTPAGRQAGKQAAQILPQITIRLSMADISAAPGAVREALIRSGAIISDEDQLQRRRITARIPTTRISELLERLERLGRIAERPAHQSAPPETEVIVLW